MRSREVSIPGMGVAALICLVATAMAMTDANRYSTVALTLFALAWIIFFAAAARPFSAKKQKSD